MGILLDKWKEKKMFNFGCVLFCISCLFASSGKSWGYLMSYILFGIGTPAIFLALLKGTRSFPKEWVSIMIALLNSSYDASVFVFTVFKMIYDRWSGIRTIFLVFSIVPILFSITTLFWPLSKEEEENSASSTESKEKKEEKNPFIRFIGRDAFEASKSRLFVFLLLYNMINMLWFNSTLGTIDYQLRSKLGESLGLKAAEIFGFVLPIGFIAGPFVGTIIERIRSSYSFFFITLLYILISSLNFVPVYEVQIFNFILFTFCRAYYYSVLAAYTIKQFGFETFGRLFGLLMFGAGIFGMLQTPLIWMSVDYFGGNFIPYNIFQLASHIFLLSFPVYVWMKERTEKPSAYSALSLELNET
eukprot:TRINITY_DN4435_c0_g1_i2.p1 TRINITY_DN4435_c0_g1~~TRINITY_DN4435_c0_g1_i2.p1  ORF type:complete len:359 (+),score=128.24 TRINITY_DN4435_c0_g1_i2:557-1633(+)